jgi:hypothetical protein
LSKRSQKKRPQPAGWNKAVRRLLTPEHVERLSDTQVRITLPPAPDFDIEEDETVRVTIPASALVNSKQDIDAGTFTIRADTFEERIDNALKGLADERARLGVGAELATFLLTFFTCEIVAKALVSHVKYGRTGRKALADKWSTKDLAAAMAKLGIPHERSALDALFSEEPALASEMSARKLRDCIAHRMKDVHRNALRARYDSLLSDMDKYLATATEWRRRSSQDDKSG